MMIIHCVGAADHALEFIFIKKDEGDSRSSASRLNVVINDVMMITMATLFREYFLCPYVVELSLGGTCPYLCIIRIIAFGISNATTTSSTCITVVQSDNRD